MTKQTVVLDIETRPDPSMDSVEYWQWFQDRQEPDGRIKDPIRQASAMADKVEKARGSMALQPHLGICVVLGLQQWSDDAPTILVAKEPTRQGERDLLLLFREWWRDMDPVFLVGWCIKRFDIPFLAARMMVHSIELPWFPAPRNYRRVFDLRDDLAFEGSLSAWQYALGAGFKEVEGADLLNLTLVELAEHCRQDLVWTMEMARRTHFIWRGQQ